MPGLVRQVLLLAGGDVDVGALRVGQGLELGGFGRMVMRPDGIERQALEGFNTGFEALRQAGVVRAHGQRGGGGRPRCGQVSRAGRGALHGGGRRAPGPAHGDVGEVIARPQRAGGSGGLLGYGPHQGAGGRKGAGGEQRPPVQHRWRRDRGRAGTDCASSWTSLLSGGFTAAPRRTTTRPAGPPHALGALSRCL